MSFITALDVIAYSVATQNYLEQLLSLDIMMDGETVKAEGAGDRYKLWQLVKQGHKATFRHKMPGTTGENALCNLDLSAVSIGGVSYLSTFRNGTIKATTITKDPQVAANGYRSPVPVGTDIVFDGDFDLTGASALMQAMGNGTVAGGSYNLAVSLTYGPETCTFPGLLSTTGHNYAHEELQTVKATLKLRGTPSAPSSGATSLLGELLLGTAVIGFDANVGPDEYASTSALIEELTISVQDAQLIEQSGTFAMQGAFTTT